MKRTYPDSLVVSLEMKEQLCQVAFIVFRKVFEVKT